MFIISIILDKFSWGLVEKSFIDITANEYLIVFDAIRCITLYKFEQRRSYIALPRVEKQSMLENDSYKMSCCRNDKVSALYCMKIH